MLSRNSASGPLKTARRIGPGFAPLLAILAVAVFTRLSHLDLIDFKADEASMAGIAARVLAGKWPATSIQTSLGPFNPPLFVYLLALPMLISRDPAVLQALVAGLDVLAILVTYATGRRFFGERAGLAAAALYAADPYAVIFARKLAGTFVEPVVSALLLWFLLHALQTRQGPARRAISWHWFGVVVCCGLLPQLHLATALLLPVLAIGLALSWSRRALLGALLGGATSLLISLPYLLFELRNQPNFLATLLSASGGHPRWSLDSFRLVWVIVSSPGYGDVTGTASDAFKAQTSPLFGLVALLGGLAVAGGVVLCLFRWRDRRCVVLAAYILIPPLLTLRHSAGVRIHYFTFLEPALFLAGGMALDWLPRQLSRSTAVASAVYGLLGVLLLAQAAGFQHFIGFLGSHDLAGAYGVPLLYQREVFDRAVREVSGRGQVMVAVSGRDQAEAARYLLGSHPNTEVSAAAGLLLPAVPGSVYVTLGQNTPAGRALERALPAQSRVALPGGRDAFGVHSLPPDAASRLAAALRLAPLGRPLANGLTLVGATPRGTLPVDLASAWRVTRPVDPSTTIFNQVLDDRGKQWFDRDDAPAPARSWRPGDTLIDLVGARLPAGAPRQEYWWSLGAYVQAGRRVPFVSGGTQLRVARLKGGQAPAAAAPAHRLRAIFGGAIELSGYDLPPGRIVLHWKDLDPVKRDYTVFVHVLDAAGHLVAQHDAQPQAGRYPTSLWAPGDQVLDPIPLAVAPGQRLQIGLYTLPSGRRLAVANGQDHLDIRT
ncbi:MAG: glycosyltransferase family 39 protein [Chloroflexota bacterium]